MVPGSQLGTAQSSKDLASILKSQQSLTVRGTRDPKLESIRSPFASDSQIPSTFGVFGLKTRNL